MGDRANIVIEKDDRLFTAPLFMYTHWNGHGIKQTLQAALKRGKERWNDPQYLSRIIFSEMIKESVLEDTGYGLSNKLCDNEHDLLCVNLEKNTVRALKEPRHDSKSDPLEGKELERWTFEEFVAAKFEDEE